MLTTEAIESVKVFLKKIHINVKHDWLQECVEYLYENNYDANAINVITKEQWLLNDIKQVSLGCLPPNIKGQSRFVLNGNFVLQINSVIDIGTSAYQQYNTLKNVNNGNIEATINTEDKITSRRMFKFNLTDGVQEITAIEYNCIYKIKNDLIPGCKALIKGPVVCRSGVIFLTDSCMELMGGEVNEYSITNSKILILASKLGLSVAQTIVNNQHNTAENQNNSAENQNRTGNQNNIARDQNNTGLTSNNMYVHQNNTAEDQNNRAEDQNNTSWNQNNTAEHQNIWNQNNTVENCYVTTDIRNNNCDNQNNSAQNRDSTVEEYMDIDEAQETRQSTPVDMLHNNDVELEDTSNIVRVSASPFVYIKQINELNECDRNGKIYKVKAQILYLLKQLGFTKDSWIVECKITDGTGCLNVKLDSDLFSEMISHKPQQMAELGVKRLSNPTTRERIDKEFVKYLSEAKRKLESLYCIMELKIATTPVITKIIPFEEQHLMMLERRQLGL